MKTPSAETPASKEHDTHENDHDLGLPADPIDGFLSWLKEAESAKMPEPTSMTLATATLDGTPNARIVLFKGISQSAQGRRGLRFFTNYDSPKSKELASNPRAALVFHWVTMQRQIRFSGRVEKLSAEESNEYFQSRPRGSRIGAWASPQSQKIRERAELEARVQELEKKFEGQEIPCPPNWGGWRFVPERAEFWLGHSYRLHDRFVFEWNGTSWVRSRLAP